MARTIEENTPPSPLQDIFSTLKRKRPSASTADAQAPQGCCPPTPPPQPPHDIPTNAPGSALARMVPRLRAGATPAAQAGGAAVKRSGDAHRMRNVMTTNHALVSKTWRYPRRDGRDVQKGRDTAFVMGARMRSRGGKRGIASASSQATGSYGRPRQGAPGREELAWRATRSGTRR